MAWILSLKVFLISTALVFTALGLKAYLPLATASFTTLLSLLSNFFLLCFKPPYIYVIVNAIIITIVASSRFQHHSAAANDPTPPPNAPAAQAIDAEIDAIDDAIELKRVESPEYLWLTQKPPFSARFGRRKRHKSSAEVAGGRSLRVARPQQHETLENTWKMITEGRAMPLSRHMKKCDTWHNRGMEGPLKETGSIKISDTSKDITPVSTAWKLRKEPSLSQDELNRRVEDFIRKFNHEMRLQRQESLGQYMDSDMINRGSE